MPRYRRELEDNGIYHVLNRGHNKDRIFIEDRDFYVFKAIIEKYQQMFSFKLYHYCIMPNHFHLLMRIRSANDLWQIMKGVSQSYVNYYNKNYEHVGYLFQNRYKSIHINNDSYLLECARYIERNPVRAKLANSPSGYRWSSYNYYVRGLDEGMLARNPLFDGLGGTADERIRAYVEYISNPRPYDEVVDDRISAMK